jgi:hypothetical protein
MKAAFKRSPKTAKKADAKGKKTLKEIEEEFESNSRFDPEVSLTSLTSGEGPDVRDTKDARTESDNKAPWEIQLVETNIRFDNC